MTRVDKLLEMVDNVQAMSGCVTDLALSKWNDARNGRFIVFIIIIVIVIVIVINCHCVCQGLGQ